MRHLIEKHKTKIAHGSPIFLSILIILGAFYILSKNDTLIIEEKNSNNNKIALQQFENLDIKAQAFIVYDATLGKTVYAKNEMPQLPLASLAKIMSTIVALELANKNAIIDILPTDKFDSADDKYLPTSGKWHLGDLLKFTLVASSNSGINIITDRLSSQKEFLGGDQHFLRLMNDKAKQLGLNQTYFLNESGLDINQNLAGAYGSPRDVALLFNYATQNYPDVFGATRYNSITINSVDGKSLTVPNTNQAVSQIKNLVASKTGLTDLAQGNLVIALDTDKKNRIIIVVMGSTQDGRFLDAETLAKATLEYYSSIQL